MVSDSFDIYNAVESVWGGELKELVLERGKTGGTLVIRPDSGDPPEVVVKVKYQEIESKRVAFFMPFFNPHCTSCLSSSFLPHDR